MSYSKPLSIITTEALVLYSQGKYLGLEINVISPFLASSIFARLIKDVSLLPITSPFNILASSPMVNFIEGKIRKFLDI